MHYNVPFFRAVLLKSLHQTFCVCCFSCVRKFFNDFLVINFCILSVTGFMIGSCQEIQCISLGIIQFITFSKIGNCRIIISLLICRISCFVKIIYCRNTHFAENRTIQGLCIIRKGILIDCFQFLQCRCRISGRIGGICFQKLFVAAHLIRCITGCLRSLFCLLLQGFILFLLCRAGMMRSPITATPITSPITTFRIAWNPELSFTPTGWMIVSLSLV